MYVTNVIDVKKEFILLKNISVAEAILMSKFSQPTIVALLILLLFFLIQCTKNPVAPNAPDSPPIIVKPETTTSEGTRQPAFAISIEHLSLQEQEIIKQMAYAWIPKVQKAQSRQEVLMILQAYAPSLRLEDIATT